MLTATIRRNTFWLLDFLSGGNVYRHFKEVNEINSNPCQLSEKIQFNLRNLIQHATTTTPYYEKYRGCRTLDDFPVINKEVVKENTDKFLSIKYKDKDLYTVSTSGSTGIPFTLQQDANKRNRLKADLIYFGKVCGYEIGDKYVHLRVWSEWKKKRYLSQLKQNVVPVDISRLDDESINQLYELLNTDKKIRCINGYAKSLDIISKYFLENSLIPDSNIKVVISSAEVLTEGMKKDIGAAFNSNVVSRYANEEIGFLAQQPVNSDYFLVNEASVYMEFLKLDSDDRAEPGETSRIVVTDLFNYAYPLIRYDTGDLAQYDFAPDGRKIITEIHGRAADFIYDTNGRRLVSFAVTNKMERLRGIKQYQLLQTDTKAYTLSIVADSNMLVENEVVGLLKSVLGEDALINVDMLEAIEPLASGKYKTVICEI